MKFAYQFSNLCGTVYRGGNLLFTPDGNSVLSPVGNRVTLFDLVGHRSTTLPFENHKDIEYMAMSPSGGVLVTVDGDGRALLVNLRRRVVLAEHHFKRPVRSLKFSPDGAVMAVTHGPHVQLWQAPPLITEHRPFHLLRTLTGHYDDVVSLDWSPCGRYLLTASKDSTMRVYCLVRSAGGRYTVPILTGHRSALVGAFFGRGSADGGVLGAVGEHLPHLDIYSVSKDGSMFEWRCQRAAFEGGEDDEAAERRDGDIDGAIERKIAEVERLAAEAEASRTRGVVRSSVKAAPALTSSDSIAYTLYKRNFFNQNHAKVECCALYRPRGPRSAAAIAAAAGAIPMPGTGAAAAAAASLSSASSAAAEAAASDDDVVQAEGVGMELLVVGFDSGVFGLWDMPDFNCVHTLSISQQHVESVAINASGEWLALGCPELGQLLVWEWQSESQVLKQQGHFFDVNAISFSPDGQLIATGGDDGKVKIWNSTTGFCFVTFAEHTGPVSAVEFSATGTVVFSASYDGTLHLFSLSLSLARSFTPRTHTHNIYPLRWVPRAALSHRVFLIALRWIDLEVCVLKSPQVCARAAQCFPRVSQDDRLSSPLQPANATHTSLVSRVSPEQLHASNLVNGDHPLHAWEIS